MGIAGFLLGTHMKAQAHATTKISCGFNESIGEFAIYTELGVEILPGIAIK